MLWEMLYEDTDEQEPDWSRFWGLRTPITHWNATSPAANRIGEIRLESGLFSNINDGV